MNMEHDARRLLPVLVEEPLENVNDELHGRVVVVQHQDLVHGRLLRLRLCLDDDTGGRSFTTVPLLDVTHLRSNGTRSFRANLPHDIGFGAIGESPFHCSSRRSNRGPAGDPPRTIALSLASLWLTLAKRLA